MIGEKKMEANTTFYDKSNAPVCKGWLPEGYQPAIAEVESDRSNTDFPMIIWLSASNGENKRMFNRIFRKYSFDKLKQPSENGFMEYDEYLDTNALSILKAEQLRLVRRYCLTDEELENLRAELIEIRESFAKHSIPGHIEKVVQSLYGASGAKLYEADTNGEKRYLLLTVRMLASESGTVNLDVQKARQSYQELLQQIQSHNYPGSGFGGYASPQPSVQQPASYDTDPRTPFGQHRTDGFISSSIIWDIHHFSGFESPVEPTENEVRDFLSFALSAELHPQLVQALTQYRQQLMSNMMQENQMLANSFQQTMRMRQQSFDRSFAAMKSVSDMSFNMTRQRVAANNAAFDRQTRMQHEAIMGVNTYQRTDGSTVEVSVGADRVFQATNDPTTVVGIEGAGPTNVPFGWTELTKLK